MIFPRTDGPLSKVVDRLHSYSSTMLEPGAEQSQQDVLAYTLHGNRYLNITSRCTLRCTFCPKFAKDWNVQGYELRLHREPSAQEVIAAAGDPRAFNEVVFCGFGEPTLRLYVALEVARRLRQRGGYIRLNTDGLANLVYERDITPDLEDNIDALSVSLNAQDEMTYNRVCRPQLSGSYGAMLDFVRRARDFVPHVTLTAIDGLQGVDIAACEAIAHDLGVHFRRRVLGRVG